MHWQVCLVISGIIAKFPLCEKYFSHRAKSVFFVVSYGKKQIIVGELLYSGVSYIRNYNAKKYYNALPPLISLEIVILPPQRALLDFSALLFRT